MSNQSKAKEAYSQMSPSNKEDPSSMYLLYKVALRCRDSELGDYVLLFLGMDKFDKTKLPNVLTLSALPQLKTPLCCMHVFWKRSRRGTIFR